MKKTLLILVAIASLSQVACGGGAPSGPDKALPAPIYRGTVIERIEAQVDEYCADHGKNLGHTPLATDDSRWPASLSPPDSVRHTVLWGFCVDKTEYVMGFDNVTGERVH
jgi:hypothetical protein